MNEALKKMLEASRRASVFLNRMQEAEINRMLLRVADAAERATAEILAANEADLSRMNQTDPKYDRLQLSQERIAGIASDIRKVASLPFPVGQVLSDQTRPNGMRIRKMSVPFGVVGVIYEARPNVTFDVFSLCLKSGNACVLKGGSDAEATNRAIAGVIRRVLEEEKFDPACITLLPSDHDTTKAMLRATGYIDVVIPRGSKGLIGFVRENAQVPVIETGAGVCHCYFHSSGDLEKGRAIVCNAKTRRVSVCNALDCLLVDRSRLSDLPALVDPMVSEKVVIRADADAYDALSGKYPYLEHADAYDWGCEYLDYLMSVKTVDGIEEALEHIASYSSKHSESIVAADPEVCDTFRRDVDAACVYVNLPTSFTDGGQFGFGAEIGISTQKLHARGPMGLPELTTYKYIIDGDGQVRPR